MDIHVPANVSGGTVHFSYWDQGLWLLVLQIERLENWPNLEVSFFCRTFAVGFSLKVGQALRTLVGVGSLSPCLASQSCVCKAALSHHIMNVAMRQISFARTLAMALLLINSAGSCSFH